MMLHEKLVERDINQLRLPTETVRLHVTPEDMWNSGSESLYENYEF